MYICVEKVCLVFIEKFHLTLCPPRTLSPLRHINFRVPHSEGFCMHCLIQLAITFYWFVVMKKNVQQSLKEINTLANGIIFVMYNIIDSENYNFTFCLQIIVLEAILYLLYSICPNESYSLSQFIKKMCSLAFITYQTHVFMGIMSQAIQDLNGAFKKSKLTMT